MHYYPWKLAGLRKRELQFPQRTCVPLPRIRHIYHGRFHNNLTFDLSVACFTLFAAFLNPFFTLTHLDESATECPNITKIKRKMAAPALE